MYKNLIEYPDKLEGATIKAMKSYRGFILIALEDERFGILCATIAEEVEFLKQGEAHVFLSHDSYASGFFKDNGCHDMEAIEREAVKLREQEARDCEKETIEREKKLLAELKAKYE